MPRLLQARHGRSRHPLSIDHPLPGAVYLAKPHENPFDSLLAIYITVNDPKTGIVVKLPGLVQADPQTGQLTTTVRESPQVPFEDFKLNFFGGARGALRTPPTCGSYETTSELTPYSAPESGPPATPADPYTIDKAANGSSACAHTPSEEENKPGLEAGTETPSAGAYSPFLLKLHREDGSQELKQIDTTLPPGLTGKLAGIPECSEAALAAAKAKTGTEEQQSPSCPAASKLGAVNVAAGAGPDPYYAQGNAYLAGPYQGAPLSLAIITPALAGPFDLGDVVVRAALQVNPETAQITVNSGPIPTILQGIPLDIRTIAVKMDKPNFTLNPTDCEKMAVTAQALSALGQSAALTDPFQVGGCNALGFKPKVAISLKGGTKRNHNPALKAVVSFPAKGAYANIAKAQVTLPHREFLDQAHIGTVCTRVQFAEGQPRRKVPGGLGLRLRQGKHAAPGQAPGRPGLPAQLLQQAAGSGRGFEWPDRRRPGRPHRHRQGRGDQEHLRGGPRCSRVQVRVEMKGGNKGLLVNSENICKPQSPPPSI